MAKELLVIAREGNKSPCSDRRSEAHHLKRICKKIKKIYLRKGRKGLKGVEMEAKAELAALFSDLLGLHCVENCHLLLLLLKVSLFVLETILDDSFDDLFRCDRAAGVDGDELFHDLWNRVGIAMFWWNRCLAVNDNIDIELFD